MIDFLETLRKKPEETRKKIALTIALSIMLIIFIFWLLALIWKVEYPSQTASSTPESLSADIANFFQKAKSAAPSVSL